MSRSLSVSGDMTNTRPVPEEDPNFDRAAENAIMDAQHF